MQITNFKGKSRIYLSDFQTGHIFVYTGLMNTVQNEDQLAVVMGHEMAHAILMHGVGELPFLSFLF